MEKIYEFKKCVLKHSKWTICCRERHRTWPLNGPPVGIATQNFQMIVDHISVQNCLDLYQNHFQIIISYQDCLRLIILDVCRSVLGGFHQFIGVNISFSLAYCYESFCVLQLLQIDGSLGSCCEHPLLAKWNCLHCLPTIQENFAKLSKDPHRLARLIVCYVVWFYFHHLPSPWSNSGNMFLWLQFLSMRLAAVNPRIDFNLDSIFTAEVSIRHLQSCMYGIKLGIESSFGDSPSSCDKQLCFQPFIVLAGIKLLLYSFRAPLWRECLEIVLSP